MTNKISFFERLKADFEKRNMECPVKENKKFSRKEAIAFAKQLKEPLDEYLLLSNNVPKPVMELTGGRIGLICARANHLSPKEMDKLFTQLGKISQEYMRTHPPKAE